MAKKLPLTLGQFTLMSEAHLKFLAMQGYEVQIVDLNETAKAVSSSKTSIEVQTPVAEGKNNSKVDKSTSGRKSTKGGKSSSRSTNTGAKSKTELKFGQVKVGDLFITYDNSHKDIVNYGKAVEVDEKARTIKVKNGHLILLDHSVAVSKAEYGKAKKLVHKEKKEKKSTDKSLSPVDYKIVFALNLKKLGKISEEDFTKATAVKEFATELYHQHKGEVKLAQADAVKLFAEYSAKSSAPVNA